MKKPWLYFSNNLCVVMFYHIEKCDSPDIPPAFRKAIDDAHDINVADQSSKILHVYQRANYFWILHKLLEKVMQKFMSLS